MDRYLDAMLNSWYMNVNNVKANCTRTNNTRNSVQITEPICGFEINTTVNISLQILLNEVDGEYSLRKCTFQLKNGLFN